MDVREQYFNWMYDMVFTKRTPSYVRLLRYLNSQEFTYNIRLDGNRADDGLYLRYRFKQENHLRAVDVDRWLTGKSTEGSGLLLVNPKTREVKTYRHSPSNPQSISSNYIRSLALDSQNRLWIGTFNDLNIYHEGNDSFMSYSSNPVESGSLSQRSVRSIFMDSQGGMWLGTYFGGLNYYHPIRNRFKNRSEERRVGKECFWLCSWGGWGGG